VDLPHVHTYIHTRTPHKRTGQERRRAALCRRGLASSFVSNERNYMGTSSMFVDFINSSMRKGERGEKESTFRW
jgi:hypothetical protein